MLIDKTTQIENISQLPLILAVNSSGEALGWITYERSAFYYAKDKVAWSLGQYEVVLRGGINAKSGKQSILSMDTIVALSNDTSPYKHRRDSPPLTNKTLFERDLYMCAYCGGIYKKPDLTRDHVHPQSKGGKDTWENCVTACKTCNNWKGDKDLASADLQLKYVPYAPSYNEHLILQNRKLLGDQMEYLMKGVSKNSRLHDPTARKRLQFVH